MYPLLGKIIQGSLLLQESNSFSDDLGETCEAVRSPNPDDII